MLQIFDFDENEIFFSFMDELKPWVKQELQHRGVKELTKAITIAESLIELVPREDKFGYFKPKEKGIGGRHEERTG